MCRRIRPGGGVIAACTCSRKPGGRLPRTADEERCGRGSGKGREGERCAPWAPPDGAQHAGSRAVRARSRLSHQLAADRVFELRAEAHEGFRKRGHASSSLVVTCARRRRARETRSCADGRSDRELLGNLVVRQLADHAQLERLALVLGEAVERGREARRGESRCRPSRIPRRRRGRPAAEALAGACLDAIEAYRLAEDVPGDSEQPRKGRSAVLVAKAIRPQPRLCERLGGQVASGPPSRRRLHM